MILCHTRGWLLFDENYLLLGCNYLSDYSPETFLSKHLGAFERLKSTCSFRFAIKDTEIFICLFLSSAFLMKYSTLLTSAASLLLSILSSYCGGQIHIICVIVFVPGCATYV